MKNELDFLRGLREHSGPLKTLFQTLMFELRALHLLGRYSITLRHTSSPENTLNERKKRDEGHGMLKDLMIRETGGVPVLGGGER